MKVSGDLGSDENIKIKSEIVDEILDNKKAGFLVAIVGLKGNKRHLDVAASNEAGDAFFVPPVKKRLEITINTLRIK